MDECHENTVLWYYHYLCSNHIIIIIMFVFLFYFSPPRRFKYKPAQNTIFFSLFFLFVSTKIDPISLSRIHLDPTIRRNPIIRLLKNSLDTLNGEINAVLLIEARAGRTDRINSRGDDGAPRRTSE